MQLNSSARNAKIKDIQFVVVSGLDLDSKCSVNAFVTEKKMMLQTVFRGQILPHQVISHRSLRMKMTYTNSEERQDKSFAQFCIQKVLDYAIRHSSRTDTEKEADFKLFFKVRLRRSPV